MRHIEGGLLREASAWVCYSWLLATPPRFCMHPACGHSRHRGTRNMGCACLNACTGLEIWHSTLHACGWCGTKWRVDLDSRRFCGLVRVQRPRGTLLDRRQPGLCLFTPTTNIKLLSTQASNASAVSTCKRAWIAQRRTAATLCRRLGDGTTRRTRSRLLAMT